MLFGGYGWQAGWGLMSSFKCLLCSKLTYFVCDKQEFTCFLVLLALPLIPCLVSFAFGELFPLLVMAFVNGCTLVLSRLTYWILQFQWFEEAIWIKDSRTLELSYPTFLIKYKTHVITKKRTRRVSREIYVVRPKISRLHGGDPFFTIREYSTRKRALG